MLWQTRGLDREMKVVRFMEVGKRFMKHKADSLVAR